MIKFYKLKVKEIKFTIAKHVRVLYIGLWWY